MIRPLHALAVALLGLALLGAGVRPEGLGDVRSIAVEKTPTHTRVVIELSQKVAYTVNELSNPRRLYVDIDEVWIEPDVATARAIEGDSALRQVRGGQNTLRRSRVVLELDAGAPSPVFSTLDSPFRIVAALPVRPALPEVAAAGDAEDWDQRSVRRIVIDAGHGGKDPGALGPERAREAAIVLAISRELERELTRRGFEIVMTRKTDVFLPLEARTDIANRRDADLFISVHANAARNRKLAGVETYLLDTRYDRQTARVAARENGTTVAQLSELHKILASLRLGNNERYAARYAELVQHSLVSRLRTTGFARLAAQGIADGVSAYREQQARRLVARR